MTFIYETTTTKKTLKNPVGFWEGYSFCGALPTFFFLQKHSRKPLVLLFVWLSQYTVSRGMLNVIPDPGSE